MRTMAMALAAVCLVALTAGWAADAPQYGGPNRDGKFADTGLLKQWPADGPRLVWSVEGLGGGWSSASVAGGAVYVTGMDAAQQGTLFAFDTDGKLKWKASYGAEDKGGGHPGARSTPTVDGDRVYLMSSAGHLMSFDVATGKPLLDVDTIARFGAVQPKWAIAESPLIDGDRVICTPGGPDASIVALNKLTGETVWTTKGLSAASAYCSPLLLHSGERRLLLTQLAGLVVGVDAETGQVLWQQPLANAMGIQPLTPLYADGMIYANAGRKVGGVGLQLAPEASGVTVKWTDATLEAFHHGLVLVDGYVYGTATGGKQMFCLELATGKVAWTAPATGVGCVVYADGLLYVYAEDGRVQLVKANPAAFEPVSTFTLAKGTAEHWAHPTIANGRLYLRHGDALMAYDIAAP
ncbi:MAG: PQQ-binding-like beta-propeller repeat protein [Armatimonadota bacterium]